MSATNNPGLSACNGAVAMASDRSLVHVGDDGWLFDHGAERSLIELFRKPTNLDDAIAQAWIDRLAERHDSLQARGVEYVHMPIPDKLTLFAHRHRELDNPAGSPILQLVDRHERDMPSFLNLVPYLSAQVDKYPVYWKTANHWSAWGCFLAYQLLCSRLKIETNTELLNYPFTERREVLDLGACIEPPNDELVREYHFDRRSSRVYANPVVRFIEHHDCSTARDDVTACNVIFRNDTAHAVDACLVLFGSRLSGYHDQLLTGMLAETFREVHFIGGERFDDEYLRRLRPDFVISEMPEAHLLDAPGDSIALYEAESERLQALRSDFEEASSKDSSSAGVTQVGSETTTDQWQQQRLLDTEIYRTRPPVMVQDGCDQALADANLETNPVDMHQLKNARVYFNGIRCLVKSSDGRDVLRYGVDQARAERVADEAYQRLRGRTFMLAPSPGAHCYYHWMLDILPLLGLLERAGTPIATVDHFLLRELTGDFQRETLARFGIDDDRLVEMHRNQYVECDDLTVINVAHGINMKMHRFVPLWIKHNFQQKPMSGERIRLYISRPAGVRRGISNEAELVPILESAGYTIVAMEGMSVAEQASLLARADVLISPHGGALTNMVFCRPGIQVVEILSRHVYPYYYGLAQLCGHRYHALLENPQEDYARLVNYRMAQRFGDTATQHQTHDRSFRLDPALLARMLERL